MGELTIPDEDGTEPKQTFATLPEAAAEADRLMRAGATDINLHKVYPA